MTDHTPPLGPLPEPGIDTANHAGLRIRGYTADDIRAYALQDRAAVQQWRPIESAPQVGTSFVLGVVDGVVRLIRWGKTSHVPLYGWCLADQGPEDFDLCKPTHWAPLPPPPPQRAEPGKDAA